MEEGARVGVMQAWECCAPLMHTGSYTSTALGRTPPSRQGRWGGSEATPRVLGALGVGVLGGAAPTPATSVTHFRRVRFSCPHRTLGRVACDVAMTGHVLNSLYR